MRAQRSSNIPSCIVVLSVILCASADCYDIFGPDRTYTMYVDLIQTGERHFTLSLKQRKSLFYMCKTNLD